MRILTFTSLFPNATAPDSGGFVYQRTSHLAKSNGNLVEVIAPVPYLPKWLRKTDRGAFASVPRAETIGNLRVHHPRYPLLPGMSMPFHGLLMFAGCIGLARSLHQKHHFDCIDGHYIYPDGEAATLLGKYLGVPVAISARGTDIHTFPGFRTIRPQIKWTLRHADMVVAVSQSLAEIMTNLEPQLDRVEVIGNGVDAQRFFPEDRLAARQKLGLDPNQSVIVSVAALRPVKGPELLVRAAAFLKQRMPNFTVLFVGAGPELTNLQHLASQLNCAGVCQFAGSVANEDLRAYYTAANVSCLASRKEGWPNVILESLACGTPVVATRVGAVPNILTPACGVIVDPEPESICDGLHTALQRDWNPDMVSTYAQRYTWENVAERVDHVLSRFLASKPVADPSALRV